MSIASTARFAMRTTTDAHAAHGACRMRGSFLSTYVFSRDHKIIGIQFLFSRCCGS